MKSMDWFYVVTTLLSLVLAFLALSAKQRKSILRTLGFGAPSKKGFP
jgi:hypothetical protein